MDTKDVFRNRSNTIRVQLQSAEEPLVDPAAIERVEVCVGGVTVDSLDSLHVDYDAIEGILTMRLGMIDEINELRTKSYPVAITAYPIGSDEGIAFPGLRVSIKDWCP